MTESGFDRDKMLADYAEAISQDLAVIDEASDMLFRCAHQYTKLQALNKFRSLAHRHLENILFLLDSAKAATLCAADEIQRLREHKDDEAP